MYDDIPTLMAEIKAGEDTLLELKEVVFQGDRVRFAREEGRAQRTLAEVFASMANTEGGVVVFGVNDDREPVGMPEEKKPVLEHWVVNACRDLTRPPLAPILDWVVLPDAAGAGKLCLKVTIAKDVYAVVWTRDQRPLKRVGSHRQAIRPDELARLMARRGLISPFEERPAMGAKTEDLAEDAFESYYINRFGASFAERGTTPHEAMRRLKLLTEDEEKTLRPTVLGLLLFGKAPETHLPQAYVDIASYEKSVADGNTTDSKRVEGRLPEQVDTVLRYLQASPLVATRSTKDGAGRHDRQAYSMLALQEALVNAVVHRDYEIAGSQTRVYLFPDRIEFWNPGGLHNTLRVEDLFAGCQPVRRNQLLAGFFRDYRSPITGRSYMEAQGEGFLNMIAECERVSERKPDFRIVGQAICLAIYAASPARNAETGA